MRMNYEKAARAAANIRGIIRRIEAAVLLLALLFTLSTIWDAFTFTGSGLSREGFPGFDVLKGKNPDIAAWIRMDGTHIDHPVVQGEDNFEYLTMDAYGEYYQGGSILLDAGNKKDFTDQYIIIHGHHMSRGAMFSDLTEYLDKSFFDAHDSGELITPGGVYSLTVVGAKVVNAYEGKTYYVGEDAGRPLELIDDCVNKRDAEFSDADKLVMLSTCAGDMTNDRAIVFCRASYIGEYTEDVR